LYSAEVKFHSVKDQPDEEKKEIPKKTWVW